MFGNKKFVHMFLHPGRMAVFQIIISGMLFIAGCLCLILTERIVRFLPLILGTLLILLSILRFSQVFDDLKYTRDEAFIAGNGTLYLVLGIIILAKNADAYYLIGIAWGILGLIRDSRNFTAEMFLVVQKQKHIKDALWHIIYAILLILDPPEHLHFHVMVFGLELFDSSFRVLRDGLKYEIEQSLI